MLLIIYDFGFIGLLLLLVCLDLYCLVVVLMCLTMDWCLWVFGFVYLSVVACCLVLRCVVRLVDWCL